jgi:hypothetical protein
VDGNLLRTVARAVAAAWRDKGAQTSINDRQVLDKAGQYLTTDELGEALGYLGFRSCIEAKSTPTPDNPQALTIYNVDLACLGHYLGD